ncbi:TIGR00730 family Rossman fold protein [Humibacter ginsenosidimutans]|uniref:TIGR00730 family Rossman fold protein n=1 Tax=Humibacter ginsenosidimutans TaxID=2599293 RepID=A0A5B8LY33_9MICO|nr:TIGR00730 family Rossman fold protein [Humibacter ginsenosidimutans]QDZ13428.1 TIGR00730 family Rossman fold protein [Humibacter ginsenosidimutans]
MSHDSVESDLPDSQGIARLIAAAGIHDDRDLVTRMVETAIGLGVDAPGRLDLKISTAALEEMRAAFRLFAPFSGVKKVTIFGSARTKQQDALYRQTTEVASALAAEGWMVVTGAGPGIMQAAVEGAGPDKSIGVSIRLPFEEHPDASVQEDPNVVTMKYFFTRKLMLVKESSGFICLPGGFGTLDEMFELLTLQQTGKAEPVPIVLLDAPGGTHWKGLARFVDEQLVPSGVIAPDDFERVLITDSVDAAAAEITGFWRNYDSLRWVGDLLVLRLRHEPTDDELSSLNERFGDFAVDGAIRRVEPLRAERQDDDKVLLPRLALRLEPHHVGDLFRLIGAVNALPSAV